MINEFNRSPERAKRRPAAVESKRAKCAGHGKFHRCLLNVLQGVDFTRGPKSVLGGGDARAVSKACGQHRKNGLGIGMTGVVGGQDERAIDGPKSAQTFTSPTELQGPLQQHEATLGNGTGAFDQGMVKSSLDVFGSRVGG